MRICTLLGEEVGLSRGLVHGLRQLLKVLLLLLQLLILVLLRPEHEVALVELHLKD